MTFMARPDPKNGNMCCYTSVQHYSSTVELQVDMEGGTDFRNYVREMQRQAESTVGTAHLLCALCGSFRVVVVRDTTGVVGWWGDSVRLALITAEIDVGSDGVVGEPRWLCCKHEGSLVANTRGA